MEQCMPHKGNNSSHSNPHSDYIHVAFISIVVIELSLNLVVIFSLLADKNLLRKQFSWFIFFELLFDSLSFLVQVFRLIFESSNPIIMYVYFYLYEVFLTISIWLLAYRTFMQQRSIRSSFMPPSKSNTVRKKRKAFVILLKTVVAMTILSIALNILLPIGHCEMIMQMYLMGYPVNIRHWNYFLLFSNFVMIYIPCIIMVVSNVIIIYILFRRIIPDANTFIFGTFNRRLNSSILLICFVTLFGTLVLPSQVYRFYLFFKDGQGSDDILYHVLNGLSFLYMPLTSCTVFLLSVDVRNSFKMNVKKLVLFLFGYKANCSFRQSKIFVIV